MTFDLQTTLIIAGAAIFLILLLWLLLRSRRQRVIERPEADAEQPYVAATDRPYMQQPLAPPPTPSVQPPLSRIIEPLPAAPVARAPAPAIAPPRPAAAPDYNIEIPPPLDAPDEARDDLTRLKGVGPKLAALLYEQEVTSYAQLAALGEEEVASLDARLGAFRGRLTRDRVPEQARLLAAGDKDGFEAQFGKLGG